jgi:protein-disulfide isomerase
MHETNEHKEHIEHKIAVEHRKVSLGKNPWFFVSIILGVLLLACFSSNIYLISKITKNNLQPSDNNIIQNNALAKTNTANNQANQKSAVSDDGDPSIGSKDATVTIIEFSDFQCPFCERFYLQTFPQIKLEYIDTGKVRFVYRDFPLSFHAMAQKAAEAAECANEQEKFWEYHDKIFQNQASLSKDNLKLWAKQLGLDTTKFDSCLDTGKYQSEVQKDQKEGISLGVSGTPAFFINGKPLIGAQPFAAFKQLIDAELSE